MSLQSKYAAVVARELRHHAVWEPGEPVRLGDYGILGQGRFSVHGNIKDDFEIEFDVARSRNREFAFRSDGVSESRSEAKGEQVGAAAELRVGFRSADALYVSSPSAWTEQIKGLARAVRPLSGNPQWRPEWMVVTRLYHASQAIILLSNSDDADVCLNLSADGVALAGDSSNDAGENGSVALQLTGVRGPLFMGLHWVHKDLEDVVPRRRFVNRVLVLGGLGLVVSGALASWLVVVGITHPNEGARVAWDEVTADRGDEPRSGLDEVKSEDEGTGQGSYGGSDSAGGGSVSGGEDSGGEESSGDASGEADAVRVHIKSDAPAEIRRADGTLLGRTDDPKGIGLPEGVTTRLVVVAKGGGRAEMTVQPRPGAVFFAELVERGSGAQGVGKPAYVPDRPTARPEEGSSSTGSMTTTGGSTAADLRPSEVDSSSGGSPSGGSSTTARAGPDERELPPRRSREGMPAMFWGTLVLGLLGLGLVCLWIVRRFLAPLEPVRPEDVEGRPPPP
jgi:hypothetical protein